MLSPHTLLIAAIFVPYAAMMTALGVYIYRTGAHRDRDEGDPPDTGDEDERAGMLLAA